MTSNSEPPCPCRNQRRDLNSTNSYAASGPNQLTQAVSGYTQSASTPVTVASPPTRRTTTAEQSSKKQRHIQRRCSTNRRPAADRHPMTAHPAVATANRKNPNPATPPDWAYHAIQAPLGATTSVTSAICSFPSER